MMWIWLFGSPKEAWNQIGLHLGCVCCTDTLVSRDHHFHARNDLISLVIFNSHSHPWNMSWETDRWLHTPRHHEWATTDWVNMYVEKNTSTNRQFGGLWFHTLPFKEFPCSLESDQASFTTNSAHDPPGWHILPLGEFYAYMLMVTISYHLKIRSYGSMWLTPEALPGLKQT